MMSSPPKNYKIIVDSKHFGNMKGIRPAEVAKKAASKILCLSNNRNRITKFSMVETKNGKIRNYKAFKENLIRPYHKCLQLQVSFRRTFYRFHYDHYLHFPQYYSTLKEIKD